MFTILVPIVSFVLVLLFRHVEKDLLVQNHKAEIHKTIEVLNSVNQVIQNDSLGGAVPESVKNLVINELVKLKI